MADVLIRAPGLDEKGALLDLVNAHGHAMWGEDIADADEVHRWFTFPAGDPQLDLRAAVLPDGRFAGFARVIDPAEDHAIIWVRVVVHPELGTEAIGEELFRAADARARERGRAGTLLHAGCAGPDSRIAGIYQRGGYRFVRHFFRMVAALDKPPAAPVWPEGIALRPLDPDRDLERVHAADEEAFEDHWGTVPTPFDVWRHWLVDRDFDPSLWFVACDADEIAGLALCRARDAGDPDMGWVDVVAVRRPWRRRGLALALLLHAFAELRARGRLRVGLGVDAENTTGAVGLYEQAGMRPTQRFDVYEVAL